jgi:hypothetical protein
MCSLGKMQTELPSEDQLDSSRICAAAGLGNIKKHFQESQAVRNWQLDNIKNTETSFKNYLGLYF